MTENERIALAGASAATAASLSLVEFARNGGDPLTLRTEEVVEQLADAIRLAIDAQGGPCDEAEGQLFGTLIKFLEDTGS